MAVPEEMADAVEPCSMAAPPPWTRSAATSPILRPTSQPTTSLRSRPLVSLIEAGDELRTRLAEITMPVLVVTSRQDHVVNPADSDLLAAAVSGPVERVWLERSYHVVTLDYDKAEVEAAAVAFAEKVTAG